MINTESNYYDKENDVMCSHPEFVAPEEPEKVKKSGIGKKIICILLVISMCLMSVGFLF